MEEKQPLLEVEDLIEMGSDKSYDDKKVSIF